MLLYILMYLYIAVLATCDDLLCTHMLTLDLKRQLLQAYKYKNIFLSQISGG